MPEVSSAPPASDAALFRSQLALPGRREGKVRDLYTLPAPAGGGPERLLVVASDRISAFDVVMPTPVPGKGRLLTQISLGWFRWLRSLNLVPDHLVSAEVPDHPALTAADRAALTGRVMVCRRAKVIPIECVARGYLAGSGFKEYSRTGAILDHALPRGLLDGSPLPQPIFTPSTKAAEGHDEPITLARCEEILGGAVFRQVHDASIALYRMGKERAARAGVRCMAIGGGVDPAQREKLLTRFCRVESLSEFAGSTEEAMRDSSRWLEKLAREKIAQWLA